MARPRSPNRNKTKELWVKSGKNRLFKDIAKELQVSEEQIRKWKNQDNWDKVTLPNGIVTLLIVKARSWRVKTQQDMEEQICRRYSY